MHPLIWNIFELEFLPTFDLAITSLPKISRVTQSFHCEKQPGWIVWDPNPRPISLPGQVPTFRIGESADRTDQQLVHGSRPGQGVPLERVNGGFVVIVSSRTIVQSGFRISARPPIWQRNQRKHLNPFSFRSRLKLDSTQLNLFIRFRTSRVSLSLVA